MAKVLAKVRNFMDLSKITTSTLEALVKLTKKRDTIVKELRRIEAAITGAYSGRKSEPSTGRRRRRRGRPRALPSPTRAVKVSRAQATGGRRGALKARILTALRAAGDKGVAVKELSSKLGVKNQNVHVWFSSTGKKLGTIQRIGAGRYRLKPGA
jgi:hypothetical protein